MADKEPVSWGLLSFPMWTCLQGPGLADAAGGGLTGLATPQPLGNLFVACSTTCNHFVSIFLSFLFFPIFSTRL